MNLRNTAIAFALMLLSFYMVLIISLAPFLTSGDLYKIITSQRVFYSIKLSVATAVAATFFSLVFGIPTGYALSRYQFRGRAIVDAALEIPLIVSPIALGALLLIFFKTSAGSYIQNNAAIFVFEIKGIILAQFITSAGIAARMIKSTFDEISPRYEMVAGSLGASPFYSFISVTFPLARRGIIAATAVTFAKCVGEFGATMTLAGTMPMKTETLPVSIFLNLSSADIEGVAALIILLITLGLATILFAKKMGVARHD